jgi:hypothetical protein
MNNVNVSACYGETQDSNPEDQGNSKFFLNTALYASKYIIMPKNGRKATKSILFSISQLSLKNKKRIIITWFFIDSALR